MFLVITRIRRYISYKIVINKFYFIKRNIDIESFSVLFIANIEKIRV